jgi:hypothetical protein
MSNAQSKIEWFGESGKIDSAEIRKHIARKKAPAPEKRATVLKQMPGIKFPDLAAKKGTKPAIASNRKRLIDLLEKSPVKL